MSYFKNKKKFISFQEVKEAACGRWDEIAQALCVSPELLAAIGHPNKHGACPVLGGKDGYRVDLDFVQNGGSYSNVESGFSDGFATLAWAIFESKDKRDQATVKNMVAEYLGVNPTSNYVPAAASKRSAPPATFTLSEREVVERKGKLNRFWAQALKLSRPEAARAIKYLESRGIKGDFYKSAPALRFHPSALYKNPMSGNLANTPAFIQMWTSSDGTPVNTHKILLSKVSVGKAELKKPKLMMKPTAKMAGGCVRIGEPAFGSLSVATGLETSLSVTEVTKQPCWATLNDTMLGCFVPPEDVNHLTVWADNDIPKNHHGKLVNSGVDAAYKLKERLSKERPEMKVVIKIPPDQGSDWNDYLVSGELNAFRR